MINNKEEAITIIGSGWRGYIETVYNMLPELSFCSGVAFIGRRYGMLNIKFSRSDLTTPAQEFILSAIEYKIERLSARVCETCGASGFRRKELPEIKALCTRCFALEYSSFNPTPSATVVQHKPQTDY